MFTFYKFVHQNGAYVSLIKSIRFVRIPFHLLKCIFFFAQFTLSRLSAFLSFRKVTVFCGCNTLSIDILPYLQRPSTYVQSELFIEGLHGMKEAIIENAGYRHVHRAGQQGTRPPVLSQTGVAKYSTGCSNLCMPSIHLDRLNTTQNQIKKC